MSIKTGISSTSTDSNSTSSALSPLSPEGSIPVVDSPGGIAVPARGTSGGVAVGAGISGGLDRDSAGLEKDLEALDLKAGSDGNLNGNGVDGEKEDDGSFDESDSDQQLRRYARDLTTYHRNLFDGVKTRDQRKKS